MARTEIIICFQWSIDVATSASSKRCALRRYHPYRVVERNATPQQHAGRNRNATATQQAQHQ